MSEPALLAPVPLVHLQEGLEVCANEGKVAFGSRAWEVFRKLDELRGGLPVEVFIYASHADGPAELDVTWRARYIGHVNSRGGAHPAGRRYRPSTTKKEDKTGHWAIFWEVEDLYSLPEQDVLPVASFVGYDKGRSYQLNFVPEGPVIVELPAGL